jgi:hypothetical protein
LKKSRIFFWKISSDCAEIWVSGVVFKEKSTCPQKLRHLGPIRLFDFPKKVYSTKVRNSKYALNAEKDFEIGYKLCL